MIVLIILGLLIRLSLLFLDFGWDVNNHIAWAKDLWGRGFQGFYDTPSSEVYASLYPNYPPLALYLFYLVYPLQWLVFKVLWWINITIPFFPSKIIFMVKNRAFEAGVLKLPAILADVALAWLIYLFAKKIAPNNKKMPLLAAAAVLFNPAFFYNSAYWGQIDVIPIFFVSASFYLLFFTRRYMASGIFFVLGLLVKPTVLVYAPLYSLFFIDKFRLKNFLKTFVVSNITFWLSFLPFVKVGDTLLFPYLVYFKKILSAQSLGFVTNGAFNFWVLITGFEGIEDTSRFIFGLSYRTWGYLITTIFYLAIIYSSWKLKDKTTAFLYGSFLCAFAAFLFLTKMHERYSMLPLIFLLLVGLREKIFLKWFLVISLMSFLNLYHSWPVPRIEFMAAFLSHGLVYTTLSLLNLIFFSTLLMKASGGDKNHDREY